MSYRKKLIEVALPLEEINEASAREKSIRHGHPSTLHLWWARRPLATCRAVLFSSIIDDPGEEGVPQELLDRIDALPLHHKYRHLADEEPLGPEGETLSAEQAALDKLARGRRYRLFTFIERLVKWENSNDPETLQIARDLINAATGGNPPPVLDPFCGGGSIPLEAQRLGLEAQASDLNPVAVLITKAMIEIPPKFANQPPINPEARANHLKTWTGAQGLAEDLRYYGQWMRDEAEKRVGQLYPDVKVYRDPLTGAYYSQDDVDRLWQGQNLLVESKESLFPHPSKLVAEKLPVIAWLWARTVPSPDPAARGASVPLVRSFVLSSKKGREAWLEPIVDRASMTYSFQVCTAKTHPFSKAPEGTIGRRGGRCLLTGTPLNTKYVRQQALEGKMSEVLMAVVADGGRDKVYLSPIAGSVPELTDNLREMIRTERASTLSQETPEKLTGGTCHGYGLDTWGKVFTDRQVATLTTLSNLIGEVGQKVQLDCKSSNHRQRDKLADAVMTYLAFVVDRLADFNSEIAGWIPIVQATRNTFARQALPMTWDYAELNPFSKWLANFDAALEKIALALVTVTPPTAKFSHRRFKKTPEA